MSKNAGPSRLQSILPREVTGTIYSNVKSLEPGESSKSATFISIRFASPAGVGGVKIKLKISELKKFGITRYSIDDSLAGIE